MVAYSLVVMLVLIYFGFIVDCQYYLCPYSDCKSCSANYCTWCQGINGVSSCVKYQSYCSPPNRTYDSNNCPSGLTCNSYGQCNDCTNNNCIWCDNTHCTPDSLPCSTNSGFSGCYGTCNYTTCNACGSDPQCGWCFNATYGYCTKNFNFGDCRYLLSYVSTLTTTPPCPSSNTGTGSDTGNTPTGSSTSSTSTGSSTSSTSTGSSTSSIPTSDCIKTSIYTSLVFTLFVVQ